MPAFVSQPFPLLWPQMSTLSPPPPSLGKLKPPKLLLLWYFGLFAIQEFRADTVSRSTAATDIKHVTTLHTQCQSVNTETLAASHARMGKRIAPCISRTSFSPKWNSYSEYPTSIPTQCICPKPYKECNGKCGSFYSCPSGHARRETVADDKLCLPGLTVCGVLGRSAKSWECVDTQNDLESCMIPNRVTLDFHS